VEPDGEESSVNKILRGGGGNYAVSRML
jgi:hypothetical protein